MEKESQQIISDDRLLAYFLGEVQKEERAEVEAWLAASEENRRAYRRVCRTALWIRWGLREQQIDEASAWRRIQRRRALRFLHWGRYAAAVLVAALLVAGGIWWSSRSEEPLPVAQVEVLPGSPKARLTLSTGEQVELTQRQAVLQEQNGSIVQWDTSGRISYRRSGQSEEQARTLIYNRIEVPRGGEFHLTLADGTHVWLNADTRLDYPVEFAGDVREVRLQGEAYFEVEKDAARPFVVKAGAIRLQVYGTAFDFNAYDTASLYAVLVNGSIALQAGTAAQEVKLLPGQMGTVDPAAGTVRVEKVDVRPYIAWKDNDMVFENERLESIMRKVERWYDVHAVFTRARLKDLHYCGDIKRYADISDLLAYLGKGSPARFTLDGRTVIITEK